MIGYEVEIKSNTLLCLLLIFKGSTGSKPPPGQQTEPQSNRLGWRQLHCTGWCCSKSWWWCSSQIKWSLSHSCTRLVLCSLVRGWPTDRQRTLREERRVYLRLADFQSHQMKSFCCYGTESSGCFSYSRLRCSSQSEILCNSQELRVRSSRGSQYHMFHRWGIQLWERRHWATKKCHKVSETFNEQYQISFNYIFYQKVSCFVHKVHK